MSLDAFSPQSTPINSSSSLVSVDLIYMGGENIHGKTVATRINVYSKGEKINVFQVIATSPTCMHSWPMVSLNRSEKERAASEWMAEICEKSRHGE